jgi:site-specific recombinase XerD
MNGENIEFKFIKPDNHIPYYFDEDDITRIFYTCSNIKHLAMLKMLFFSGLRASELCGLDDSDIDLKNLSLRVHGKGGKEGICYFNDDVSQAIKRYLQVRDRALAQSNSHPLFITDYGNRWNRRGVWRMFKYYKQLAGIEKHGGVHVFSRHSFGSMLIKNGCDILTVKELMRHSDVNTTMRYLHVSDAIKREKYGKYLVL